MSDVTVAQMNDRIEKLKSLVEKRDLAQKLEKNREFRKLILDGFCREDCASYAQLSADPALGEDQRADALGLAQAAGHLRRYLSVTIRMGNQAEDDIVETQQAIEEMRNEEANDPSADQVEA